MDITKAFDTMWIDEMLYKLHYTKGIVGKRKLIKNWYINIKEFVFIGGKASRTYNFHYKWDTSRGVLSPWLFLVFIDDLIEELKNTKAGVFLGTLYFGSPMFADDLTMLSRLRSGLGKMLEAG